MNKSVKEVLPEIINTAKPFNQELHKNISVLIITGSGKETQSKTERRLAPEHQAHHRATPNSGHPQRRQRYFHCAASERR